MKQLFIAVIFLLTITGSTQANPFSIPIAGDIPSFIGKEHFMLTFPQATEVAFKVKGQLTEVNFTWNGLKIDAFFDVEGNLVATSRQITASDLPLTAQINLKRKYADFIPTEVIEFTDANSNLNYYVNIKGINVTYLLRISADGSLSVFKKMKN